MKWNRKSWEEEKKKKPLLIYSPRLPSHMGFPCGSAGKESACNAGDWGLIPGLGRSPGEGKRYPLQYSGLENSMDCIAHGIAKSWAWLSDFHNLKSSQVALVVKNLPANAGDRREEGLIPRLERSPGGRYGNSLSILAWSIPWTEEPGGLQSIGLQSIGHNWSNWRNAVYAQKTPLNPNYIRLGESCLFVKDPCLNTQKVNEFIESSSPFNLMCSMECYS